MTTVGMQVGGSLLALPCVVATNCCVARPNTGRAGCLNGVILVPISKWRELGHEETGYEALWDPRSSTGPPVGGTRF